MERSLEFAYNPNDFEREKASNSYLMSLIALMIGMPLPIVNLIATGIFFLGNKRGTYFVRWHCMQALLSQITVVIMNSVAFYWTISIMFRDVLISNYYIAYMITVFLFNLAEFSATIYAAIETRKGKHVEWWFFGPLANLLCKR